MEVQRLPKAKLYNFLNIPKYSKGAEEQFLVYFGRSQRDVHPVPDPTTGVILTSTLAFAPSMVTEITGHLVIGLCSITDIAYLCCGIKCLYFMQSFGGS